MGYRAFRGTPQGYRHRTVQKTERPLRGCHVAEAAYAKKGRHDTSITAVGRRRWAALDPWVAERARPKLEARRLAAEAVVVVAVEPELRVLDEVAEARVQLGEDRLLLRLRQSAGGDGIVELLLLGGVEGVDETVDGLAPFLRDVGERLPVVQPRLELCLCEAEVRRGRIEPAQEGEPGRANWRDHRRTQRR